MKLLNKNVLVRVDEVQQKTESGILLADNTQKLPSSGVIEGVADGITDVKVGDRVQFLRYASLDTDDEMVRLCKLEHIIGIYES